MRFFCLWLILFFLVFSIETKGQSNDSVLIVHSAVGKQIDSLENQDYELFLFPSNKSYTEGEFHLLKDGSIVFLLWSKNLVTIDTMFYTQSEFNNVNWIINAKVQEEEKEDRRKFGASYMRLHFGCATRGKYQIAENNMSNSLYDNGYWEGHYNKTDSVEDYHGRPDVDNYSLCPLLNVDFNLNQRFQLGLEFTRFEYEVNAGKRTDMKYDNGIKISETILGNYFAGKINCVIAQYKRKRKIADLSGSMGVSCNFVHTYVESRDYSNSHYFDQWHNTWVYTSYGAMKNFEDKQTVVGFLPSLKADLYFLKHFSVFTEVAFPFDLGLKLQERYVYNKYSTSYTVPKQTVHFSGLRTNIGVAFHLWNKRKMKRGGPF